MKRLFAVAVIFASGLVLGFYLRGGSQTVFAGGDGAGGGAPTCSFKNGDVNASGAVDLSDAVTILSFLFLGAPTALVPLCSLPTGLPDSGQTKCYDEAGNELDRAGCLRICPGQDGPYATGCPQEGRFFDNNDGTVTDHCTGLMWQKDTADVTGDGQLDRQDARDWCSALAYCENLSFAGHDDWRLPNIRELQSIIDYGHIGSPFAGVAIDPVFGVFAASYWSSTSYAYFPVNAWLVNFTDGVVTNHGKDGDLYLLAVRNAP